MAVSMWAQGAIGPRGLKRGSRRGNSEELCGQRGGCFKSQCHRLSLRLMPVMRQERWLGWTRGSHGRSGRTRETRWWTERPPGAAAT